MKLTKSLRRAIAKQFKDGLTVEYLATLYGFKLLQIEDVIRRVMIEQEKTKINESESLHG